ncbi:hypothetical protein [Georgenia subflava]|uniref:DUF2249 domain-containing protein n=1 Tax=Georgenia subflava TaxID=1622177 RepID=A0A6N7EIK4_9MICO|nr:hypothetical protein [Georgenia subflava]MPV35996.1 DUF2249 domain-containing protein [Georgenia subflava]
MIRRTDALLAAVAAQEAHEPARDDLVDFLHGEVLPHTTAEGVIFCDSAPDMQTTLLAQAMAAQQRQLVAFAGEVARARTGMDAAMAASALVALFMMRAEEEDTVLLPALAAAGIDLADLLAHQPQILGRPGADAPVTMPGPGDTLDLCALDYDQCRRRLRTALQRLEPGKTLRLTHGHELQSLRYEIEATALKAYRWSLPTGEPPKTTTLVERL